MRQFAIFGLSSFGKAALEQLSEFEAEILVVDKNQDTIQAYKDKVSSAFVLDVLNIDKIEKVVPKNIDVAVIDLGDEIEASILLTEYLKRIGIKQIVVKAKSDAHGHILKLLGATMVISPNKEAVKRIIPLLLSSMILNYFPIAKDLIIAEIFIPDQFVDKNILEVKLREKYHLNVIAIRDSKSEEYQNFSPSYVFKKDDIVLVSGIDKDISKFTRGSAEKLSKGLTNFIKDIFSNF